jgi:phospholipid/cholesterol/gamma-HCH transport system substrate-binding protein
MSDLQDGAAPKTGGPGDEELDRVTPPLAGGQEIRVGAFLLVGAVAFMVVLFLMTDPATFRGRYMVATEVSDAGGIRRGDPVQMLGVNIGRVHQFDLSENGVLITLEIEGRWDIPEDSRTSLGSLDLLGGRTVQVIRGRSETSVSPGQILPGEAVVGVMGLADTLGEEARQTMSRIRALMADSAVTAVHGSLGELQSVLGDISEITQEQRTELSTLSSSLARSAGRVEDLAMREELDRSLARADSTLGRLQTASNSLANASGSLETILGRIDQGEGTLGRLLEDDNLYESLDTTLNEIAELARDLRENPDRYIRLRIF